MGLQGPQVHPPACSEKSPRTQFPQGRATQRHLWAAPPSPRAPQVSEATPPDPAPPPSSLPEVPLSSRPSLLFEVLPLRFFPKFTPQDLPSPLTLPFPFPPPVTPSRSPLLFPPQVHSSRSPLTIPSRSLLGFTHKIFPQVHASRSPFPFPPPGSPSSSPPAPVSLLLPSSSPIQFKPHVPLLCFPLHFSPRVPSLTPDPDTHTGPPGLTWVSGRWRRPRAQGAPGRPLKPRGPGKRGRLQRRANPATRRRPTPVPGAALTRTWAESRAPPYFFLRALATGAPSRGGQGQPSRGGTGPPAGGGPKVGGRI